MCGSCSLPGMNSTRFEFSLPADRRRELDQLSEETGLSAADLARLGIRWVLSHRDVLLRPTPEAPR
jgi:hypothetical protein